MPFQDLKKYINQQITLPKNQEEPLHYDFSGTFSQILQKSTTHEESVILLMALAPHVQAGFYEEIIQEVFPKGGEFPELGGAKPEGYRSMMPTGETIQYILAKNDIQERIRIQAYFSPEHWFYTDNILYIEDVPNGMPIMSGKVLLTNNAVSKLLFGTEQAPKFSSEFPANELITEQDWSDLILNKETMDLIQQIKLWVKHEHTIREKWGLNKILPKGYKALFYGASGTGKTLTASLLGKEFDSPVYRIDLSQTISKYIGETEKNLDKLFTKAALNKCILFFDEADALFGKRTNTSSSQDRFANQQVSYLLQRIEDYKGLVILASNLKNNMDNAFLRRFNIIIPFKKPNQSERKLIWNNMLPKNIKIEDAEILDKIISQYELTGAQIANVISYTALQTVENNNEMISKRHLLEGIKLEYQKEEKLFKELS